MRVLTRVVLFFAALMVILGLIGFMLRGFTGDLMYSRGQLMTWLESFPDIARDWKNAVEGFNPPSGSCVISGDPNVWKILEYQWCSSTTENGFISWFNGFAQCITVILITPIKIIGWLFSLFYMPWIVD